jgi:ferredoxin--NADP+ reductase
MLDAEGRLVDPGREDPAEFYIALVPATPEHPPGLTPRLFALTPGDRLLVSEHAKGTYQLRGLEPEDDVLFLATGTGEAPHNGMIADLLRRRHRGRIVSAVCTRRLRDLAYLATHRVLERRFPNYRYLTLTTREPRNVNPQTPCYVGKQYLQEFVLSPEFEQALGRPLKPGRLQVYLCGSPDMIGAPQLRAEEGWDWPQPRGVMETLAVRGFRPAIHGQAGDVHFEKYW